MNILSRRLLAVVTFAAHITSSFAHEGHGLGQGSHWHASDTLGLLLVGVVAAFVFWRSRGGK